MRWSGPFHGAAEVLEVGVHVARPFWSGRFVEEAARAVIAWAWQHANVSALVAGHGPENANSQALIERLGFRYTHQRRGVRTGGCTRITGWIVTVLVGSRVPKRGEAK